LSEWTVPGYTELKALGAGGFGAVVLATHDATGTAVAIKYLLPELRRDQDFAAMFRAEAEALGALDDPHVVRLYEYVESPAGAAIVMELVDGVTLWDILSRHGRTTPEAALVVLFGSLLGLAAAHARGVVHRDYKPRNVLINAHGASKLTDFGIAARAGTPTVPSGSVAYAPPEQFDGGPASPASDVYAATATFYECLAGHPPFTGATMDTVIAQHRSASVPMAPVPEPLRPIVARGMAKDPAYRPADAAALAAELRTVAASAYGPDWEQRGRSNLGEAAVLLALLWPTAGVPALHGSTVEQVHLAAGARTARAGRARKASRAAGHLRAIATAVTAAAVVAAGLTVAFTSRAPSGPGTPAHPAIAAYRVSLAPACNGEGGCGSPAGASKQATPASSPSPSRATATGSATAGPARKGQARATSPSSNAANPHTAAPPPRGTLTVSEGGTELGYHAFSIGAWIHISVANFPANTVLKYTCSSGSSFYQGTAGTSYDTDAAGATVQTRANGSASFDSTYIMQGEGMSVTCTSDTASGTFTIPEPSTPPRGATLTVTQGAADAGCAGDVDLDETTGCAYIHLVVTDFPADSIVNYGCTDAFAAGPGTADNNSSGAVVVTDASGYASFDTSFSDPPSGFTSGSEPWCTSDNVSAAYAHTTLSPSRRLGRPARREPAARLRPFARGRHAWAPIAV
jgi:hypothetical protein